MRNTCSKNVPCRKGVTSRRRCGHNGLSCSECPTPPVLSIPESKGKANVSFLLVGEVPISMQQRYFISKRCATLKAHRHFQPFFISFQQTHSSSFHYKLCNYSNLAEGLSIQFMLKPLSHMHSCTLTRTH